jgi:hypothetical protein
VVKITEVGDGKMELLVIRRGGVSEESLKGAIQKLGLMDNVGLNAVAQKHSKSEDEKLEGPG